MPVFHETRSELPLWRVTNTSDVLSLVVALYTIKLATSPSSSANSYGWQRAEILGALINGVFLLALCVSIGLEAIGRFFSPPEISNAMIIIIVGSLGLLSNIVGLFLFHGELFQRGFRKWLLTLEHGHSHGHSHGPVALPVDSAEDGEGAKPRERADSMSSLYQHPAQTRAQVIETAHEFGYGRDESSFMGAMSPPPSGSSRRAHGSMSRKSHRHGSGPAAAHGESANADSSASTAVDDSSPVLKADSHGHSHAKDVVSAEEGHAHGEDGHSHGKDDGHGHGGHSHGSMNMHGVFLHVLGDA
jgi:zinc transporter 1